MGRVNRQKDRTCIGKVGLESSFTVWLNLFWELVQAHVPCVSGCGIPTVSGGLSLSKEPKKHPPGPA